MEKFSHCLSTDAFTLFVVINLGGFPMKECVRDFFYGVIGNSVETAAMLTESEFRQLKTQLLLTGCFKLMKEELLLKCFLNTFRK